MARFIFARYLFAFGIASGSLLSAEVAAEISAEASAGISAGISAAISTTDSRLRTAVSPTPVPRQEVWQAVAAELRQQGLSDSQLPRVEDLDLPLALPALAGRKLRVSSACWDEGPRRMQFRLQCGEPGQCLPFLVYLPDPVPNSVPNSGPNSVPNSVNTDAGERAKSCRLTSGPHSALASRRTQEAAPKPAVRPGDPATAVFLSSGMRMTASVTCLERGHEGEVIRVRGLDGHVFRARVTGPARLEALPQ
jgi:hypothetical protein